MKIIIIHENYSPHHFTALFSSQGNDICYIVCKYKNIFRHLKRDKRFKSLFWVLKQLVLNIYKYSFKNKNIIFGLNPYNKQLIKFNKIISNNYSIYFTSWNEKLQNTNYLQNVSEKFNSCAAVSSHTRSIMNNYFSQIEVVYHAISTFNYSKKTKFNIVKKFIFIGTFDDRKNLPLQLQFINDSSDEFEYTFCGDGKYKDQIIELSNINEHIHYLGYVDSKFKNNHLKDYDYLILPSISEPFGIVLLEAIAAGVPCIISDIYGPKDVIIDGYNGFIFRSNDINSFKEIMQKAINYKNDQLIHNTISSSMKFDSLNLIKRWLNIINGKV